MGKTFYLESYGCSRNTADSERIVGFLESKQFKRVHVPEKALFLLLNTCAVKVQTETRMLRRIRELSSAASAANAKLIVCGCLPKISPAAVSAASPCAIQAGVSLREVALAMGILPPKNCAAVSSVPFNPFVSIIPIAEGCTGNCAYCCVKNARGGLHSHGLRFLARKFKDVVMQSREVWLTAQDTGCYGLDIGASLPGLLKDLLKSRKRFRVRVGMMNPEHLEKFLDDYLPLFEDERLYRFFHIPIQSGSDRVLKAMSRCYRVSTAKRICRRIRKEMPLASIATDVIVGFPGETQSDFEKTLELVREIQPDVLNVSRFGARPNTAAAFFPGQLHGRDKKARSRRISELQRGISLRRNKLFVGLEQEIFVSESGSAGNFVGRNGSYKPVVVESDLRGSFVNVLVERAFPTYLRAMALV